MALNNLGIRLNAVGRREEALAPTEEAVAIRRALAQANPAAYLPNLASALNNLGIRLNAVGRREEALAPTEEAVAIRRAPGPGQSRRLPPRPRQCPEQPRQPAECGGPAGGGPGPHRGSRHASAAGWPRPIPPPTSPTSPWR